MRANKTAPTGPRGLASQAPARLPGATRSATRVSPQLGHGQPVVWRKAQPQNGSLATGTKRATRSPSSPSRPRTSKNPSVRFGLGQSSFITAAHPGRWCAIAPAASVKTPQQQQQLNTTGDNAAAVALPTVLSCTLAMPKIDKTNE